MEKKGWVVGSLHTGAQAPLYEKAGWVNTSAVITYLNVSIRYTSLSGTLSDAIKCEVSNMLENKSLMESLKSMHKTLCTKHKLSGLIVRSDEYWNKWIPCETHRWQAGGLVTARTNVVNGASPDAYFVANFNSKLNPGQLPDSLPTLRVKEFVVAEHETDPVDQTQARKLFTALIHYSLRQLKNIDTTSSLTIRMPKPLVDIYFGSFGKGDSIEIFSGSKQTLQG